MAAFKNVASANEAFLLSFFAEHNIQLPPEGSRHFVTHCDEFTEEALRSLLNQWAANNCPDGVHQYSITGEAVTRLWGPKTGSEDLSSEPRTLFSRGEGRPPQPVVLRDEPFRNTDCGTIITFGGTVWTVHSGPSMPKFDNDPSGEWSKNALAFTPEEVK